MNTRQWEVRCRMVKSRVQPVVRVMAHRAINRVLLGFVILRSVILNLVARDAIGWGIEYGSLVARRALGNTGVSAGELKTSRGVIKGRGFPGSWSVARLALYGYSGCRMVRIYGSSIVGGVAGVTIRWSSREAGGVALGADGCGMNAGQWEARSGMIEVRIQPVIGVVAHRTINRILLGFVILCSVILNLMAGDAIGWRIEDRSFVA